MQLVLVTRGVSTPLYYFKSLCWCDWSNCPYESVSSRIKFSMFTQVRSNGAGLNRTDLTTLKKGGSGNNSLHFVLLSSIRQFYFSFPAHLTKQRWLNHHTRAEDFLMEFVIAISFRKLSRQYSANTRTDRHYIKIQRTIIQRFDFLFLAHSF